MTTAAPHLAAVLDRLQAVQQRGSNHWSARCPSHEDNRASLSCGIGDDGRVLLHCHAGCAWSDIVADLSLSPADLAPPANHHTNGSTRRIVATYDYRDERGQLLFQKVRFAPKDFRVRRPSGSGGWDHSIGSARRVLYRLPELLESSGPVFITEGEKDADRLAGLGFTATTNFDGAGKWQTTDEYTEPFRGREISILPDNDPPGRAHAADVARKLHSIAAEIRVVELPGLPPKGDVSDWLSQGHTADELNELVEHAAVWTPDTAASETPTASPRRTLAPGALVRSRDRGNYGRVIEDRGETAIVEFVSPDTGSTAQKELPKSQLVDQGGRSLTADAKPFTLDLIDSGAFATARYAQNYLIKGILVARQPCIIGGAQKTLKTSIACDLAIALGTGTPFLNRFEVPSPVRTLVLSGESGEFTLQETARRIAETHGRLLSDAQIWWGFRLPQLGVAEHLQVLSAAVRDRGIEVAIIDPAYLSMLRTTEGQTINFANVFEVGSVLAQVSEAFAETGCTPIINHHESKGAGNLRRAAGNVPMELQDLSQSGFAEWARQWLLIARREPYEAGTGLHRLWLNCGGSAGHGGLWAVDIDEGQQNDDFTGRRWKASVETAGQARQNVRSERLTKHQQQIMDALLQFPAGATERDIRAASKLNSDNFGQAWQAISMSGQIETCEILKSGRKYEAFKLTDEKWDKRDNSETVPLFR